VIDVLRGVALAGIIVANMRGFNSPAAVYMEPRLMWAGPVDRVMNVLIDCFISGKFITIFAILFGLGFAIQLSRAGERGEAFTGVYVRRLCGLLMIGAVHAFLIWWGDILISYALMGFFLLGFRRRPQSSVMLWTMMLFWLPVLAGFGFLLISLAGGGSMQAPPEPALAAIRGAIRIYTEGGWGEMLRERLREWAAFNSPAPVVLPRILSYFLFGLWVWRRGVLQRLDEFLPLLRKSWMWLLIIGLAGNAGFVMINEVWRPSPMAPTPAALVMWVAASIGIPALSLFYCAVVILLFQRAPWRRILTPFAAVGRTALTNYLAQSVICTTIFYGWGLGLYGEVDPFAGLLLALGIYAAQLVISVWWLRGFRFGPVEWLWRSLTYWRWQPLRRQASRSFS